MIESTMVARQKGHLIIPFRGGKDTEGPYHHGVLQQCWYVEAEYKYSVPNVNLGSCEIGITPTLPSNAGLISADVDFRMFHDRTGTVQALEGFRCMCLVQYAVQLLQALSRWNLMCSS